MDVSVKTTTEKKPRSVWSSKQILWGTVIGGPLGGFYFLSENYKAMGYPPLAKNTLGIGLISILFFVVAMFYMPDKSALHFAPFLIVMQWLLAGAYMIYQHDKLLYAISFPKQLLISLLTLMIMISAIALCLPLTVNLPSFSCAMIPGACALCLAQYLQDPHISNLMETGVKKGSTGRLLWVAALALLVQIIATFLFVFILIN